MPYMIGRTFNLLVNAAGEAFPLGEKAVYDAVNAVCVQEGLEIDELRVDFMKYRPWVMAVYILHHDPGDAHRQVVAFEVHDDS